MPTNTNYQSINQTWTSLCQPNNSRRHGSNVKQFAGQNSLRAFNAKLKSHLSFHSFQMLKCLQSVSSASAFFQLKTWRNVMFLNARCHRLLLICRFTFRGLPATRLHRHPTNEIWINRHPAVPKGTSLQWDESSWSGNIVSYCVYIWCKYIQARHKMLTTITWSKNSPWRFQPKLHKHVCITT